MARQPIVDVHVHIFPPEVRRERSSFVEADQAFRLLYENPQATLVGATDLTAYLDESGTGAACCFGFPWSSPEVARRGNEYVLDASQRFPGRVIPFACADPLAGPPAVRELERALAAGARGVGEIAIYAAGLGAEVRSRLAPVAELCREAKVPLLLHTNEPVGHSYPGKARMETGEVYELIRAHPETTWILAHWGGGLFLYHLLRKEAAEVLRNVYYDTAAGPYLYRPRVYRLAMDAAGADRLLYGSDFPLLGLPRYLKDLEAAGLTATQRALLLGGNLVRLLGT